MLRVVDECAIYTVDQKMLKDQTFIYATDRETRTAAVYNAKWCTD